MSEQAWERLVFVLALALVATFVVWALSARAARGRLDPTPMTLVCPPKGQPVDADGCPKGVWGFDRGEGGVDVAGDRNVPPTDLTRPEVCAELWRRY